MGAVVEKSTGRVIGVGGTQPLGKSEDFEIGWWLMRDTWGRGYATEIGAAAMDHVFRVVDRPRAVAIIDPGNEASVRVTKRLGMHYVGRYTGAQLTHRLADIVVDLFSKERDLGERASRPQWGRRPPATTGGAGGTPAPLYSPDAIRSANAARA